MNKDNSILISVACIFKESRGKTYWLLVKPSEDSEWELPRATVRKVESSVRAILRVMGELGGMNVKVLEEAGRGSATIKVGGRAVSQKFIYYLIIFKAAAGEILGFHSHTWLEYAKVLRQVSSKKEASQLRQAKKVLTKWKRQQLKNQ